MKNNIVSLLLGCGLSVLIAVEWAAYKPNHSTAEVEKIDGVYIFTDSRPVLPYDSLGMVHIGFAVGSQYESIRKNLTKRSRSRFPDADGLILKLNKKGVDQCIVIRFK